ncbi:MAG TPA: thiamine diphosphokinase [Tissierellaceae bacterium]|nr:thiamine diphosphokinase [Tissierellaceae bacterium]
MNALIIASGSIKNYNLLKTVAEKCDFLLCVDGGVDHLLEIGLQPNMVFGDLDSISQNGLNFIEKNNIPITRFSSIKNSTDTELAIDYLISYKYTEIVLMGVTGSRQDHTLANIFLLNYLLENNIRGKIIDSNNIIYLIDDYLKLKKLEGYYTSLIPIGENGVTLTLEGFYYNLDNYFIAFGSTLGVSNKIIKSCGKIKILQGKALVFHSKD